MVVTQEMTGRANTEWASFSRRTQETMLRIMATIVGLGVLAGTVVALNDDKLFTCGRKSGVIYALVISASVVAIEVPTTIIWYLKYCSMYVRTVLQIIDIILNLWFAMAYLASGITLPQFAREVSGGALYKAMIAITVFSFYQAILFGALSIWTMSSLVQKRNKKVVEHAE